MHETLWVIEAANRGSANLPYSLKLHRPWIARDVRTLKSQWAVERLKI